MPPKTASGLHPPIFGQAGRLGPSRPKLMAQPVRQVEVSTAVAAGRCQTDLPTDGGVKAVSGGKVPSGYSGGGDRVLVLADAFHAGVNDWHFQLGKPVSEGALERSTPYSEARADVKASVDRVIRVEVADPMEGPPFQAHAQPVQILHRAMRDPFAARLVDRRPSRLDDSHRQPGERGPDGSGCAGRARTGDEKVDHFVSAESSAASSARIRTVSSGMFSNRNTTAVTQAVCTNGNAIPSTTTAT